MYKKFFKRLLDIIISLIAIIILSPLYIIISILVLIFMGWPIFFKQPRPGYKNKIFNMYKFRTMTNKKDKDGNLLPDDQRLPKFGRFLRSTSLDELPEFFCILFGKMSFIGPRPMLVRDMVFFDKETLRRQSVMPGLTGWAQANGRNSINWDDRFKHDLYYVDHLTFMMDIKVIFLTIKTVLKREGIGEEGGDLSIDYGDFLLKHKRITKKEYDEKQQEAKNLLNGKIIAFLNCHDDDVYCFRKEVIDAMHDAGYTVLISCPYGPKLELFDYKYEFDDVFIDRRGTSIIKDFKLLCHYIKLFKRYKPEYALMYTIKPNIYGSIAARFTRTKYINNITGLGSVLNKGKLLQTFIYNLLKFALKKSKCVFFQNETNMKLVLDKGLVKGNYKLIPGSGVNVDRYELQPYPKSDNIVVFNYIGRVLEEKGVDDYIEAAKAIKKKGYKAEFNIIGFIEPTEDHYIEDLKKLEKENIINYRGQQNDVRPFIKKSHAIVHPSKYGEGMSNVLLENAASGRPLITTNNPGCFETVDDGKTGYIYEKGNVEELIKTIEKFISLSHDKKEKMGLAGRKKMEKEFDRNIVVQNYINIIKGD